jgi:hypothetical protein
MSATTQATLVWNERTKLLANALDRASTVMGAGSVVPFINGWNVISSAQTTAPAKGWILVSSFLAYMFVAVVLHVGARIVLGRLR